MSPQKRSPFVAALTCLLMLAACSGGDSTRPREEPATLVVTANLAPTSAVMVVVEVSGPGIPQPLVANFNVDQVNGVASGTITIPAGANRTITVRAYDGGGVKTHEGSVTGVNVTAGPNQPLTLVLTPLTAEVPITATIGTVTVTVTCPACPAPSAPTVAVSGPPITLIATITPTPTSPTVTWATLNPGVATVTSATSAVVTGVAAGSTSIVATFQGVAGAVIVTVTP